MSSTEPDGNRKMQEVSLHLQSSVSSVFGCKNLGGVACEFAGASFLVIESRGGVIGAVAAVASLTTLLEAEV
jgi:hypothetical protein